MIETRLFHYFLAIAREHNVTRAAESLHISQSTLSKQMKDLEEQLGKQLFIRSKRKITLTEEGEFFKTKAQEILQLVEQTEAVITAQETMIAGDVYIGAAEVPSMQEISQLITDLHQDHPGIRCHITSGDGDQISSQIKAGLVDIGFLLSPVMTEEFDYLELPFSHNFGLILPQDHPLAKKDCISPDDLRDQPLISSQQFLKSPNRIEHFGFLSEQLTVVASYNLLYNALFLAQAGLGLLMALEGMADLTGTGLVFRTFQPSITTRLYMVTKKYSHPSPAVKLFKALLTELAADYPSE